MAALKTTVFLTFLGTFLLMITNVEAQTKDTLSELSLHGIIQYALTHHPAIQQAKLDEQITERQIKGQLSGWYPQINFASTNQHFTDLQSSVVGGNIIKLGQENTSSLQLSFSQTVLNRDVLFASATAKTIGRYSRQTTDRIKSDLITRVTKGFYDVLITMQQIKVGEETLVRLRRSLNDAKSKYESGLADKTDYKRAGILLANADVTLQANREALISKQTHLKTLIGFPTDKALPLYYDTRQIEEHVAIDTLAEIDFEKQIDYALVTTQRELQEANLKNSRWAFLPTVSLFGAYTLNYQNNDLSNLYSTRYPYSYVGFTVSLPVFQGGKRMAKITEEKLRLDRINVGLNNLKETLHAEYTTTLSVYKSHLNSYRTQKQNAETAKEIYDVVRLQYINGLKSYLDLTIAETELNTTTINYYNALYQLLASEADVRRITGMILN